jgi:hypothetical protein
MNYQWKIKKLVKKDFDSFSDVIVKIYWEKIGIDENNNSSSYRNTTTFDLSLVDFDKIINYQDLKEDIVVGWIQDSLTKVQHDRINKKIEERLEKSLGSYSAVSLKEFPWET